MLSRSAIQSEDHAPQGESLPRRGAKVLAFLRALHLAISAHVVAFLLRPRLSRPQPGPQHYEQGVTPIASALMRPAIYGLLGSLAILAGASQQNSPFTQKLQGAWWFGIPAPNQTPLLGGPGQWLFVGVCAVYGGMALMLRAWYDVTKLSSRIRNIPVRLLVPVFVAWCLPLLIVAPIFSHDAYSYAAQGELMSHHMNPYLYGPGLLSTGTGFGSLTDPLWRNVTSPYGPVFLVVDGWLVSLMHHNVLASVMALRGLALSGVILFAVGIPMIARSFHRDAATAFSLAVLNPLILLSLVGGLHNDALMLGFLVIGFAVARRGHPIWGVLFCAVSAAIKIPGFIGVLYIGWEWRGSGRSVREKFRPLFGAVAIAGVAMTLATQFAGVGWRWIAGLSNPDTVRSWLDPATGVGLVLGQIANLLGLSSLGHPLLTFARGGALALSAVIGVVLLLWSDRIGPLSAIGWTCIAVVLLGPIVQPWYLAWGVVFLAPIAEGGVRKFLYIVSAVSCFLGLPGGWVLTNELQSANPFFVALFSLLLVGIAVLLIGPKGRAMLRPRAHRLQESDKTAALA